MNDYDKISGFELNSYKSVGLLNEDNLVATSDLSNAISAICYNLSNMLDKRDENSVVSGNVEISGTLNVLSDITTSSDIHAFKHGLVGKDVDFSTGGIENFAVGHDHNFYGKESFAVHDGNKVGAVGFYWKAIDTTDHLIYLASEQPQFNYDECHGHLTGSKDSFVNDTPGNDIPYFGPKASSNHQELFVPDTNIDLSQSVSELVGKFITIWNCKYDKYIRCFKVNSIQSKSVIKYDEVPGSLQASDLKTIYRYNDYVDNAKHPGYSDNQYVVYFPDADQTKIAQNFHATSTSFGCTALGDGNTVMGYNSFASGKENRAEGNYSIALGYQAKAVNNNTFAWSGKSDPYTISGLGQFGIDPVNGTQGFYIGQQNLSDIISTEITSLSSALTGEIEAKSNIWLSSAAADQPLEGGKLDKLNIVKFDSLSTYELCSSILTLSDIALIDEECLNAEGQRILSVGYPLEDTDGVNKKYVEDCIGNKLSSIANNDVLQNFCNAISSGGINAVSLEHTISAMYELIESLR